MSSRTHRRQRSVLGKRLWQLHVFVKLEEASFCFFLMRSLLKLLTSLCSLAFVCAASAHQPAQAALESKQKPLTVTIAVADSLEAVTDDRSIEETINSLKQKLSSFFDIRKVSFLSADAKNFVAENKPDFVIATTGSSPFFSETADGSYRIATRKNPATEIASQSIGSTVVALKSRTDINSFDDLKGKTIAATLPVSVSGWLAFAGEVVDLGRVAPGQKVRVKVDSYPDQTFEAVVGFVSSVAEFTPKTVQTEDLRTSLVYEVRATVADPQGLLRLGMPVTVELDPLPGKK